jgi:L-lactate dehydrogenase complex protein LldG
MPVDDEQTSARASILSRLRARQRPTTPPGSWSGRDPFADSAAQFAAVLTASHGEVLRAPSLDGALDALEGLLATLDGSKAVVNSQPAPLDGIAWDVRFPDWEWHVVGLSDGDLRAFCAGAAIGISSAVAALAETGTLVLHSGAGRSRLATLLPPLHVALVPTGRLTTDIFSWRAARDGAAIADVPANITLVSGPSKTADIEQTLAVGMHGPRRLVVILYEE